MRAVVLFVLFLSFENHLASAQLRHSGALSSSKAQSFQPTAPSVMQQQFPVQPQQMMVPNRPPAGIIMTAPPLQSASLPKENDLSATIPSTLVRELVTDDDHIQKATRLFAIQKLQQFAPVTEMGRERLSTLRDLAHDIPIIRDIAKSIESDPNEIINVLEGLRGTLLLWQGYSYLGGEEEVNAHMSLIQHGGIQYRSTLPYLTKAMGLFVMANFMLVILLFSELHEYLNYDSFRPGSHFTKEEEATLKGLSPEEAKELKGTEDEEEEEEEEGSEKPIKGVPQVDHVDTGMVDKVLSKVRPVYDYLKGPSIAIFRKIARTSHEIVMTQNDAGAKLGFLWLVIIFSWASMISLMATVSMSAKDATGIVKRAGQRGKDNARTP